MRVEPIAIEGAYRVFPERRGDDRGYLQRLFCRETFIELGLADCSSQISQVVNARARTLRGLHYQRAPHLEAKLIWVFRGTVFDVLVDIRPGSPTRGRWVGLELTASEDPLVYAPPGVAHGYLTLTDDSAMVYFIDTPYAPEHAAGLRYDDPDVGVAWPAAPEVIADRDRAWPSLREIAP
jgi:dTDP-4-dehydrorhamnose 3,5-epimerase